MSKFYSRTYFNTALMGDILSSEIFKVWYKKKYLATLLLLSSKTVTRYAIIPGNDNVLPVTRTPLSFLYQTAKWSSLEIINFFLKIYHSSKNYQF